MAIWRTTLLSKLIINLLICLSIIFLFIIVYIRKQRWVKTYTPNAFLRSPDWVIYLLLYCIPYLPVREKPIWQNNRCLLAVFLQAVSGCLLPDPLRPAFQGYRVLMPRVLCAHASGWSGSCSRSPLPLSLARTWSHMVHSPPLPSEVWEKKKEGNTHPLWEFFKENSSRGFSVLPYPHC